MRKLKPRQRLLGTIANLAVILFILLPLFPLVAVSLTTERAMQAAPDALLFPEFTLENYALILSGGEVRGNVFANIDYIPDSVSNFPNAFKNSVIVATATTLFTVVIASLAAFTVTRLGLRWTGRLLVVSMVSRMVPIVVLMIPLFIVLRQLGLLNSLTGIILTEVGFIVPYGILLLAPYFQSLPRSLEEAARIDGCSRFQAFRRVLVPLAAPGIAATAVIVFVISWHELLIPLIIASRPEAMTLPVVLASLVSDMFVFVTLMMAIAVIASLPTVVLVLLLRKFVVGGLVAGAVKG